MKDIDLNSKWENIASFKNKKGYKALRITPDCLPDLFLATDEDSNRCLLLYLPKKTDVKIKESDKSRLSISFLFSKGILIIKLKDFEFSDLFDDLILSIYSKINSISKPQLASEKLIAAFYKWSQFFEESYNKKLGENQIQGLFGELFVLKEHIQVSSPSTINRVLKAWRGLYDDPNDFVFDLKNVEVKTKLDKKQHVNISSEYQLDLEENKGLELLIVSVKIELTNGKSINDLLLEIIEMIRDNSGDLSILYQALNQKGLTIENLRQYNNLRYIVTKTETYDASHKNFPKLSKSNINYEISKLNYELRVSRLDNFLIKLKMY